MKSIHYIVGLVMLILVIGASKLTLSQTYSFPIETARKNQKLLSFQFDNDTFYKTDYYYTQGFSLKLIAPLFIETPLNPIFLQVTQNGFQEAGLSISQRIYTPKNIKDSTIQYNDRPFAATLVLDHFVLSTDSISEFQMRSSLQLGIIGPAAGGATLQNKVHDWINSPHPEGWDYQIQNDLVIGYYLEIRKPFFKNNTVSTSFTGVLNAGTLFNDIGCGVNFRFGNRSIFIQPSNISSERTSKLRFFFQADAFGKVVFYNATLMGGLFSTSNPYELTYDNISPFIFTINATAGINWKNMVLTYGYNYLTKEFKAGTEHTYGSVMITVRF